MAAPRQLDSQDNFEEVKRFLYKILDHWPLIVISLLVAVIISFMINRWTTQSVDHSGVCG